MQGDHQPVGLGHRLQEAQVKTAMVIMLVVLLVSPLGFFLGEKLYLSGRDRGWWS